MQNTHSVSSPINHQSSTILREKQRARKMTIASTVVAAVGLLPTLVAVFLLSGCAASPQSAGTHSSGGRQSVVSAAVNSASAQNDEGSESVYLAPPTGSLLGGGYVRVAAVTNGTDEKALLGTINQLNAAAGIKTELPYVISGVSRATGVSEAELQAQQDILRLQFGQLCAINAIARGDSNKVSEIASLKAKGKTWTELAISNQITIAAVAQTTRNADQFTVTAYSNAAERAHGGADKLKSLGLHAQPNVRLGD